MEFLCFYRALQKNSKCLSLKTGLANPEFLVSTGAHLSMQATYPYCIIFYCSRFLATVEQHWLFQNSRHLALELHKLYTVFSLAPSRAEIWSMQQFSVLYNAGILPKHNRNVKAIRYVHLDHCPVDFGVDFGVGLEQSDSWFTPALREKGPEFFCAPRMVWMILVQLCAQNIINQKIFRKNIQV